MSELYTPSRRVAGFWWQKNKRRSRASRCRTAAAHRRSEDGSPSSAEAGDTPEARDFKS
jgi:hypothetical protein